MLIRQSTAITIPFGPLVSTTDGFTPQTALSVTQATIRLSKNGAAFAQKNDATTSAHMENGYYALALNATDTNTLGNIRVAANIATAMPVWQDYQIVPANVYDSLVGNTDYLLVDTFQVNGINQTARDLGLNIDTTISSRLATSGYTAPPLISDISTAIWNFISRTLTPFSPVATADQIGLSCTRGDTFTYTFSGLDLTGFTKVYFTVKKNYQDIDTASIIQVNNVAGLTYLNGAIATDSTQGSLVINSSAGTAILTLSPILTSALIYKTDSYVFDLEIIKPTKVTTPASGIFSIVRDVTRAIV